VHRPPPRPEESRGRHRPVPLFIIWHLLADPGVRYTDLGSA